MVRCRLVSRPGFLCLLGLIYPMLDAFLIIERCRWLAFRQQSVGHDMPFVEQGQRAIKRLAYGQGGASHCISLTPYQQLIFTVLELQGEIFGEFALVM